MFNKNKSEISEKEVVKEKTAPKLTDDENVAAVIKEIIAETVFGSAEGDEIIYDNYKLNIKVMVKKPEENQGMYITELAFAISHPYFDEPIIDNVVGVGRTPQEALVNGASNFAEGTLESVFNSLDCNDDCLVKSEIMGQTHIFRKPASHETQYAGCENKNMQDLWKIVQDAIPHYLGTKKAYWIKLFTACSNDKPVCEVSVNGMVCQQLTQRLFRYVKTWSDKKNYHSEKQFFLLIQQDSTYKECDITKERVVDLTLKSIELLKQVKDDDTRARAVNTIKTLAKDDDLAIEMCSFLPEIYTQLVLGLAESDGIVAVKGENNTIPLMKPQIRTYGYIEDTVKKYIYFEKPSKEDSLRIMCLSSKMQAANQAVTDGKKLEDLIFPPSCYFVSEDYTVR